MKSSTLDDRVHTLGPHPEEAARLCAAVLSLPKSALLTAGYGSRFDTIGAMETLL